MSRADRAFAQLLTASAVFGIVLAIPLLITLAPGPLQRALHGSGILLQACAAALYELGRQLPPVGIPIVMLGGSVLALAVSRAALVIVRTRAFADRGRAIGLPRRLELAASVLRLDGRVTCVADATPLAYTAGLVRPRIRISTGAIEVLADDELRAVLAHERAHLERGDPRRVLIGRVLASAFAAFPLVSRLAARFEIAKELDADLEAVDRVGRRALAGALLTLGDTHPTALVAVGAWSLASLRVDQLCGERPTEALPPLRAALIASVLAVVVTSAFALAQIARANLLPATLVGPLFPGVGPSDVHMCPLPVEGVLL